MVQALYLCGFHAQAGKTTSRRATLMTCIPVIGTKVLMAIGARAAIDGYIFTVGAKDDARVTHTTRTLAHTVRAEVEWVISLWRSAMAKERAAFHRIGAHSGELPGKIEG